MKIVLFCHSLLSDWNHGNAHFLRGLSTELCARGHDVRSFEPIDAWSAENLIAERGSLPTGELAAIYPTLRTVRYDRASLALDEILDGADLVLVHEWNEPAVVAAIGRHRARSGRYRLLFHDTHHRSVTDPKAMDGLDLSSYDGVLAFGEAIREQYLRRGWADRVWTFHEAADARVFAPRPDVAKTGDVVWVGNWGDDERTAELEEFLLGPIREKALRAEIYGVRYPETGRAALERAGAHYRGFLPNYRVPDVFARHRVTVHVPRRPYARALPGIPTIRMFEALACGIPVVSAPWDDAEGLFGPGDYVRVRNGIEASRALAEIVDDPSLAGELARHGRETVLARHTCAHRADELLEICLALGLLESEVFPGRASTDEAEVIS